jgi:hypothetical protein
VGRSRLWRLLPHCCSSLEFEGKAIAGAPVSHGDLRTIDEGSSTLKVHVTGSFDEFATFFRTRATSTATDGLSATA